MRASSVRSGATIAIATAITIAACKDAPPAYPSALVVVDTDLPVPSVVSHLQVDVYDADGRWVQDRQFAVDQSDAWPVSFGVFLPDDSRSTDVLVRLRAFAMERDYRGERFFERKPYVPARVARSLDELCASAPELPPGQVLVQRAGPTPLFGFTCEGIPNESGSVAANVAIERRGTYRFEVLYSLLRPTFAFGTTLRLMSDCTDPDPTDAIVCSTDDSNTANGRLGNFVVDLQPGHYTLVTGSALAAAYGDVALRWTEAASWGSPQLPPPVVPKPEAPEPLELDSSDGMPTPSSEPAPDATVDRLVRLHLTPGDPITRRVTLTGACAGTMANLAVANGVAQPDAAMTCIDDPSTLVPAPFADDDSSGVAAPSAVGTFGVDPCAPEDSDDSVACVPGGTIVLGQQNALQFPGDPGSAPGRIATVKKFWIDRDELTVARYRAAVNHGFDLEAALGQLSVPEVNDGPMNRQTNKTDSTLTTNPGAREDFPLNTLIWDAARLVCKFVGGDLPSEAQWERAASFGADRKPVYPWGDTIPSCSQTVFGRTPGVSFFCTGEGPLAITDPALAKDVSALGIRALGGNVSEWVLGNGQPYDSACWRGATALDPVCLDPSDATRVSRGGNWNDLEPALDITHRRATTAGFGDAKTGFRCAHTKHPVKR
jgi:formylglycine-generating enzyme required for sulfatase activity